MCGTPRRHTSLQLSLLLKNGPGAALLLILYRRHSLAAPVDRAGQRGVACLVHAQARQLPPHGLWKFQPESVHLELIQRQVRELVQTELVGMTLGILTRDVLEVVREGTEASLLLDVVVVLAEILQELVECLLHVRAGLVGTGEAQHAQARDAQGFHHDKTCGTRELGLED